MDHTGGRVGSERFELGRKIVRRWRRESDGGCGEEENKEKKWGGHERLGRHCWIREKKVIDGLGFRENGDQIEGFLVSAGTETRSKRSGSTGLADWASNNIREKDPIQRYLVALINAKWPS